MKVYLAGGMHCGWREGIVINDDELTGDHRLSGPEYGTAREGVFERNKAAITESDHIFCWIEDRERYGTVWELGFAHALGKPCTIAFDATLLDEKRGCQRCGTQLGEAHGVPFCDSCGDYRRDVMQEMWISCLGATLLKPCEDYPIKSGGFGSARDAWMHFIGDVSEWSEEFNSKIEQSLFHALCARNLKPEVQYTIEREKLWINLHGDERKSFRPDFAFPDRKVVIECDGQAWHSSPEQRKADAIKDRELQAAGWRVLRFTGSEITADAVRCARSVERFLDTVDAEPASVGDTEHRWYTPSPEAYTV